MPSRDLLDVAADTATLLERHGLVACGRRVNGITRIDFWTHGGKAYSLVLEDLGANVDDIVARCLAAAGARPAAPTVASAKN